MRARTRERVWRPVAVDSGMGRGWGERNFYKRQEKKKERKKKCN